MKLFVTDDNPKLSVVGAPIQTAIQPGSVEGVPVTAQSDTGAIASDHISNTASSVARGALVRWLLSYGTFGVPQAAGPIAFALLAIPLTGRPQQWCRHRAGYYDRASRRRGAGSPSWAKS
jgi:hypothetical protein